MTGARTKFRHDPLASVGCIDACVGPLFDLNDKGDKVWYDVWCRRRSGRSDQVLLRHGNEEHEYEALSFETIMIAVKRNCWHKAYAFENAMRLIKKRTDGEV